MTEIAKEIVKLTIERAEMCHSGIPCAVCMVDKFNKEFNIKAANCNAIYMVMKLLGCNKYSAEYYLDQCDKLEEICHENKGRCLSCKFHKETEGINCLCYIIGNDLLREV